MTDTLRNEAYRAFVSHLVARRLAAGVTQVELAARLGKPQSYVSKVERYERRIDVAEFWLLASALGLDAGEVFAAVVDQVRELEPGV